MRDAPHPNGRGAYIMKHSRFFKNAAIISLGGLLAKGIGALYRIPLANLLGGYGEGLYHMAYPLFCLMLTFSSAGIPTVVARTVAAERASGRGGGTLAAALKIFAALGTFAALMMALLAVPVARLQGDEGLVGCYLALAPAVLPVALLAVLRGWWQGQGEMFPTAISEIVEQLVKAGAGLLLASRYAGDPIRAARAALLAVTVSEVVALLFLSVRAREKRRTLAVHQWGGGMLLVSALPVMANAALMPLSQMLDSVLVVRLLSRSTTRAVNLYGLFAGSALSLISLPATLCYGLVAAAVPAVASCMAKGERGEGRRRALFALAVTLALALPCGAGLLLLAPYLVGMLYPALSAQDATLLTNLLRLMSVSAASLAAVDTLSACLTAMGLARRAVLSMLIAVVVKALLQVVLVGGTPLGIMGAAIATNGCYLVAFFLDLFYTVRKKREKRHVAHHRIGDKEGGTDTGRARGAQGRGRRVRPHRDASLGGKLEGGGNSL